MTFLRIDDDRPFIVLTKTKFSIRYIPVWARYNKHFTMTCDGEAHWYLSVKYTRDPSGRVSASQELYIDKILK
jgi:hypothetical protein